MLVCGHIKSIHHLKVTSNSFNSKINTSRKFWILHSDWWNTHLYISPYRFGIDGMGIRGIYRAIYSNEIKFVCYNSSIRTPQLVVPSVYLSIKVTFHTFIQTNPFPTKLLRESKTHIRINKIRDLKIENVMFLLFLFLFQIVFQFHRNSSDVN